ncbi:MAG: bifunctional pyr operon transcriptional regulator/uracil phosphoribosyltransferase PyrR [Nitrospinota bacterium]
MTGDARCILTAEDTQRALDRMAAEIVERNRGARNLGLVGIRTRGEFLAKRLQRSIESHADAGSGGGTVPTGVLDATIYRDDYDPLRASVQIRKTEIPFDVDGVHVVLVDDVLWTGRTARAAMTGVMSFGRPSRISLAVLVDREGRELPISADFCGKEVSTAPDERVKVLLRETDERDEVLVIRT